MQRNMFSNDNSSFLSLEPYEINQTDSTARISNFLSNIFLVLELSLKFSIIIFFENPFTIYSNFMWLETGFNPVSTAKLRDQHEIQNSNNP